MYLRTCAPSEDSDQPAHSSGLIMVLTGCILDSQRCKVSPCGQKKLPDQTARMRMLILVFVRRICEKVRFVSLLAHCLFHIILASTRQNQQNGKCAHWDLDQTGHPLSLIRVFAVRSVRSLGPKLSSCGQRRLIRLGGCSGWSESSQGTRAIFLHFVVYIQRYLSYNLNQWANTILSKPALTFTTLWVNSADDKLIISLLFLSDNRFWHFTQMSPMKTVCKKCQNLFPGKKNKNNILKYRLLNFYPQCSALQCPKGGGGGAFKVKCSLAYGVDNIH